MARSRPKKPVATPAVNGVPQSPPPPPAQNPRPHQPHREELTRSGELPWYCGADLPEETLRWIWPQYLPRGVPVLCYGPSQRGKSTVVRSLAAAVTRGVGLPSMPPTEPGAVLWYAREEQYRTVVRPRLAAAGAAMPLIHFPEERRSGGLKRVTILDNIRAIQEAVERTRAALVVFDPLTSFVGGEAPAYSNESAMACMEALTDLGISTGCACLGIMQPKKGGRGPADEQISGGMEWFNRARVVYLNAPHPDTPNEGYWIVQKTSLAERPPSYRWRRTVRDGESVCEWGEQTSITADTVATGGEQPEEEQATNDAVALLRDWLREGPQLVTEIINRATYAGLSIHQMRRARVKLGARFSQEGGNDTKAYYWCLNQRSDGV
jgi:putative DNA primase/helicase